MADETGDRRRCQRLVVLLLAAMISSRHYWIRNQVHAEQSYQSFSSSVSLGCVNVFYVCVFLCITVFIRLDALAKALSVIATATWLAGWLAGWLGGWLSHSGIVSKPLNLSENFFDHLKAPSF